ncbi:MAG: YdcF family protein [Lachnospiraceae bacterium]|nr:YdcF family protein [Lachnospiraceae bacterium]
MRIFWGILGGICLVYCLSLFLAGGYGTKFFLIWGVLGIVFLFWAKYGDKVKERFPKRVKKAVSLLIGVGVLTFVIVECVILSGFFVKGKENLDYIIVLGAQVRENGPSYVLQKRLDAAYEYLENNPSTIVIVSGGQGSNEPTTEAQGMYEYLIGRGIAPERILMEGASRNTSENIRYSMQLFDAENSSVGIVTNNFHVFRGVHLARAEGCADVYGIVAGSHPGYLPNNMLREFFGVVKDFLSGNLT